jgi:transposase InsO family protein
VKREALRVERFAVLEGGTRSEAADAMGVCRRTLQNWEHRGEGPLPLRGRPRTVPDDATRRAIIEHLEKEGPHLGVEPLKLSFSEVPRRGIEEIVWEYRESYALEHAYAELTWRLPGAVWAMDHTKSPGGRWILNLRDLASGLVLEWAENHPAQEDVIAVLGPRIDEAGAPLVLKSDQGSAFTGKDMQAFLNSRGILHLLSPPDCPTYNGSIESTQRWMKLRTRHQAMLLGNAHSWSAEALEQAKAIANTQASSRSMEGAEALWKARPWIPDAFRKAFSESVAACEQELLAELGLDPSGHGRSRDRAKARRVAIERALVAHGILHITRRAIPLRIRSRPWAKIG